LNDIASNLRVVKEGMARATERSGRPANAVTLVAVTKLVPIERILEAVREGITDFGENRVQEAEAKFAAPGETASEKASREGIRLHMIGTLQRNKARHAASLFDWVHSVDRPELAEALDKAVESERPQDRPLPILLQVNLTEEPTKSGVSAADLPRLADALANCAHLKAEGLMTIARLGATEAELHRAFGTLRHLLDDLRRTHPGDWRHLSMGMSDDYEIAIEEGATMVRIGRAIFGERNA
jgi:PLP dependent protein